MKDFISSLGPVLLEHVLPLVMTLLGLLSTWLVKTLKDKFESERASAVLDSVHYLSQTIVEDLQQTVVEALKNSMADGKLTQSERERIKAIALDRLRVVLGPAMIKTLDRYFGNVDSLMDSAIEASVHELKLIGRLRKAVDK